MLKRDIRQGQQEKIMTTMTTNTSYKIMMSMLMQDCRNEANKDKRIDPKSYKFKSFKTRSAEYTTTSYK
jgi:hypothetical protein